MLAALVTLAGCTSTPPPAGTAYESHINGAYVEYPSSWRIVGTQSGSVVFLAEDARGALLSVVKRDNAANFSALVRTEVQGTPAEGKTEFSSGVRAQAEFTNDASGFQLHILQVFLDCHQNEYILQLSVAEPLHDDYLEDFSHVAESARCS